jgi:alpha-glucosidase
MYTLCNEAWETGVPAVRALVLEYPDDTVTLGEATKYEYLLGKNFLVAPVYSDTNVRDNIYLPEGKWFDYWDGTAYEGKTTLNGYLAPLEKLPLFVKAGSIIPMYQQMNYDNERHADTLTLDIYPGPVATFEMFEDEGSNREYRQGKFTKTKLTAQSDENGTRLYDISISAAKGDFKGKLLNRTYILQVHSSVLPKQILVKGTKLKRSKTTEDFNKSATGWYFNPEYKKGMIFIKTSKLSTADDAFVKLKY